MSDLHTILIAARARLSEPREADYLLSYVLGRSSGWIFAHQDANLEPAAVGRFEQLLQRRLDGEPIAYITGRRGFWSLELEVSPATLIPRPETETLVEAALARMPVNTHLRLADLGTGSGAIALALASERPLAEVWAVDVSPTALEVAQRNAIRCDLQRVQFRQGDWLAPLSGHYDLIVSNPPYIESQDPHLQQGDLRFEPATALASGPDGLDAIRAITAAASERISNGGYLIFEHGWNQGPAVRAILSQHGWHAVETIQDLEARDRVSLGQWPA